MHNIFINKQLTKSNFEKILKQILLQYNKTNSLKILDNLKLLSFKFATIGGFSLSLNDFLVLRKNSIFIKSKNKLKNQKRKILYLQELETSTLDKVLEVWGETSDFLKTYIITFFKNFDPYNNLFLMSASGARGSLDQVYQMIGMRGLMTDQSGKVVSIPIKNSFKEGLTLFEYLLSAFGARKGVVDTALKTADSGYLTRRLVETAYNIVIRDFDCFTSTSFIINYEDQISLNKNLNNNWKGLNINLNHNSIIDENSFFNLKNNITYFSIRSPLTCRYLNSICQKCFGLNLSSQKIINIGDTIGILAAQSISEPSTQLTMRTFHTGGIFNNKIIEKVISKISGFTYITKNSIFIKNWKNTDIKEFKLNLKNIDIKETFISKNQDLTKILFPVNENINFTNKFQNYIGLYSLFFGSLNFKEKDLNYFLDLTNYIVINKIIKKNIETNYLSEFFKKILNKYIFNNYILNILKDKQFKFFLCTLKNLKIKKNIYIIDNNIYLINNIKIKFNNKNYYYYLFFIV